MVTNSLGAVKLPASHPASDPCWSAFAPKRPRARAPWARAILWTTLGQNQGGAARSPLAPPLAGPAGAYRFSPFKAWPTLMVSCLAFLDSTLGKVMVSTPCS